MKKNIIKSTLVALALATAGDALCATNMGPVPLPQSPVSNQVNPIKPLAPFQKLFQNITNPFFQATQKAWGKTQETLKKTQEKWWSCYHEAPRATIAGSAAASAGVLAVAALTLKWVWGKFFDTAKKKLEEEKKKKLEANRLMSEEIEETPVFDDNQIGEQKLKKREQLLKDILELKKNKSLSERNFNDKKKQEEDLKKQIEDNKKKRALLRIKKIDKQTDEKRKKIYSIEAFVEKVFKNVKERHNSNFLNLTLQTLSPKETKKKVNQIKMQILNGKSDNIYGQKVKNIFSNGQDRKALMELVHAIQNGKIEDVKKLIKKVPHNNDTIMKAAREDDIEMVCYLFGHGAKIPAEDAKASGTIFAMLEDFSLSMPKGKNFKEFAEKHVTNDKAPHILTILRYQNKTIVEKFYKNLDSTHKEIMNLKTLQNSILSKANEYKKPLPLTPQEKKLTADLLNAIQTKFYTAVPQLISAGANIKGTHAMFNNSESVEDLFNKKNDDAINKKGLLLELTDDVPMLCCLFAYGAPIPTENAKAHGLLELFRDFEEAQKNKQFDDFLKNYLGTVEADELIINNWEYICQMLVWQKPDVVTTVGESLSEEQKNNLGLTNGVKSLYLRLFAKAMELGVESLQKDWKTVCEKAMKDDNGFASECNDAFDSIFTITSQEEATAALELNKKVFEEKLNTLFKDHLNNLKAYETAINKNEAASPSDVKKSLDAIITAILRADNVDLTLKKLREQFTQTDELHTSMLGSQLGMSKLGSSFVAQSMLGKTILQNYAQQSISASRMVQKELNDNNKKYVAKGLYNIARKIGAWTTQKIKTIESNAKKKQQNSQEKIESSLEKEAENPGGLLGMILKKKLKKTVMGDKLAKKEDLALTDGQRKEKFDNVKEGQLYELVDKYSEKTDGNEEEDDDNEGWYDEKTIKHNLVIDSETLKNENIKGLEKKIEKSYEKPIVEYKLSEKEKATFKKNDEVACNLITEGLKLIRMRNPSYNDDDEMENDSIYDSDDDDDDLGSDSKKSKKPVEIKKLIGKISGNENFKNMVAYFGAKNP